MRRLRRYWTGLVTFDGEAPRPPYKGAGWAITLERKYRREGQDPRNLRLLGAVERYRKERGGLVLVSYPHLVVRARSRLTAQEVLDRVVAGHTVLSASGFIQDLVAVPEGPDLEGLTAEEARTYRGQLSQTEGLALGSALAVTCSKKRKLIYALMKLASSIQQAGMHWRTFDPDEGAAPSVVRLSGQHVLYAQWIVLAYAAIEEMGLALVGEVFKDGKWIPSARTDIESRLERASVPKDGTLIWTVRGVPTRLERERPPPDGPRPAWARGEVRDRHIPLVEALGIARWVRSKVSAHASSTRLRSLTRVDVHNVQMLARHLLLETVGFLPGRERWRR